VDEWEVNLRIANLPKGLLKALAENNPRLTKLTLAHLVFSHWLLKQEHDIQWVYNNVYALWLTFIAHHIFAFDISPLSMGITGNSPSLKPLDNSYLPAVAVEKIVENERECTAWYQVSQYLLTGYLEFARSFSHVENNDVRLNNEEEALEYAELLLKTHVPKWLLGFRDITNATNERTVIASVAPRVGVGHTMPIFEVSTSSYKSAALLGSFCSIIFDFIARQKIGGTHLTYSYLKQFTCLPPDFYQQTDLDFIVVRILELTYTSYDLQSWAQDLGYVGSPYDFDPERRAQLRAELDAWYAKAYGLSCDELRYILDPADVMSEDYPSETFRVLKNNELREFGEYRTRRLVLEAWDKLERGELL
jgi:hypothetical protein